MGECELDAGHGQGSIVFRKEGLMHRWSGGPVSKQPVVRGHLGLRATPSQSRGCIVPGPGGYMPPSTVAGEIALNHQAQYLNSPTFYVASPSSKSFRPRVHLTSLSCSLKPTGSRAYYYLYLCARATSNRPSSGTNNAVPGSHGHHLMQTPTWGT